MKRKLEHPPEATGKKYWRSLDELENSSNYREWLEREFPESVTDILANPISRRSFLRIMGASMALAGVTLTSCHRPITNIVPFTKSPEWLIPGKALLYATAMPRRRGAMPLMMTTFEGRPTKVEGNPNSFVGNGSTDIFAQASVLDLYDPDRSRRFTKEGFPSDSAEFFARVTQFRKEFKKDKGASLAFLVEETSSPTRQKLQKEISKQFPKATWASYDPQGLENEKIAQTIALGRGAALQTDFSQADVVFSLDSNFLDPEEGGLKASRDFSNKRRVQKAGDTMNRLYAVENRYTITGGMADHRLKLPASHIPTFALLLLKELKRQGAEGPSSRSLLKALDDEANPLTFDARWLEEAARDLIEHRGRSLVIAGKNQPVSTHLITYAINEALENWGKTIKTIQPLSHLETGDLQSLSRLISAGRISTLFILGGNPVYTAPSDLEWARLQSSVNEVIHLSADENETSSLAKWHVPQAHFLESWGDALSEDGIYLSMQPMIQPLFGGISEIELLARIAGETGLDAHHLVQKSFGEILGTMSLNQDWKKFVHEGFLNKTTHTEASAKLNSSKAASYLKKNFPRAAKLVSENLEIVFSPSPTLDDGRYNNNGWMQEMPDPITKLVWDNAALISPKTANKLGLKTEDVIRISFEGRDVEAPVFIAPGHADFSISLDLGYGRKKTGKVGKGAGFNAYKIRTSEAPYFGDGATITKLGKTYSLATTQTHYSMEGRALVREANREEYEQDPHFVKHTGVDAHGPEVKSFYKNPEMTGRHQWGMTVDLNSCTGCNACVVACQSENNIPIVGKDQVKRGREMHWIRNDVYFSGEEENPEMVMEPVMCQHCENAPCETVCPVNATVHNEEGLNVMTYNRCIGTRYCAFNYFDFNERPLERLYEGPLAPKGMPEIKKMQKNPNVTVRTRGVMEKCTFCVQRIETARIDAKVKAGASSEVSIPTDTVKTACQQVCPTEAIVFGDINDPNSHISKMKESDRRYEMLSYLAVFPRVSYLARIRNPNMKMPDAEKMSGEHH